MTLCCALILTYLVISEIVDYVTVDTVDVLTVDTRRGVLLPIYMDIYFPRLTCLDVAVDVVEASSGESLEEAAHQIVKQRVTSAGVPLAEGIQKGNNHFSHTCLHSRGAELSLERQDER